MITIGKKIYSILSNDSVVTGLVGAKIYPLIIPENGTLPCIVYERSYDNKYTKDGLAVSDSLINLTILSENYKTTIDISEAVFDALNMFNDETIMSVILSSGSETYAEGAFIQNLTFGVKSI